MVRIPAGADGRDAGAQGKHRRRHQRGLVDPGLQRERGEKLSGGQRQRIATARMDRRVARDAGRILEKGTHRALLAAGGLHARLWRRQSGGFLPASEPRPGERVAAAE